MKRLSFLSQPNLATMKSVILNTTIVAAILIGLLPVTAWSQPPISPPPGSIGRERVGSIPQGRPPIPPANNPSDPFRTRRDPTEPPDRILERLPPPELQPPTTLPSQGPTSRRAQPIVQLPQLPQIQLKGIVLGTPDRGRAMLDVDGRPISISLLPLNQQQRLRIPAIQFAAMKPALDQRAASLQALRDDDDPSVDEPPVYEMCLKCSFIADGVVLNLEAFTTDALLLRAIPHNTLLLIRNGQ
ncbi:MAG: hypothetical protein AAF745_16010 [Planctomycetota bacterium]